MKRQGILNGALAEALAGLGHTDLVVVGDCGLPRPPVVAVVDLALTFGVPTFAQVIEALDAEIVVEGTVAAHETATHNPTVDALLRERFGEPARVSHEELKALSASARLFVRTGEATAYANVLLRCGVPF